MTKYAGKSQLHALEDRLDAWVYAKEKMVSSLLEGRRVLDVGSGIGTFASLLAKRGFDVTAVEMDPRCVPSSRNKGVTWVCGNLFGVRDRIPHDFDSVTLLDVLEHIEDQDKALAAVRNFLAKDGVVVVTVPAFNFLYSRHDRKIGHYRRYTLGSLRKVMAKNGFKVEKSFYWNAPGVLGWLLTAKILKRDPTTVFNPFLNKAYGKWFSVEPRCLPFGLTAVVKARKT
ncbi:MAG: class I SAM-dependent methyltransferase [Candidatus Micrarchaeia archaeon]